MTSNLLEGDGHTFTLVDTMATSSSIISGKVFEVGGGINVNTPFFEAFSVEFTASYSQEMTMRTTFKEEISVSYTIKAKKTGIWKLIQRNTLKQFKIMRFGPTIRYREVPVYDSKGNFLRYNYVFDHFAYMHTKTDEFFVLKNLYYTVVN